MLAALVAVSLVLSGGNCADDKDISDDAKKDLKKFEGKWKAVKLINDGKEEAPMMGNEDLIVEFKGRTFLLADMEFFTVAALDPSTSPKCFDFKALKDMGEVVKGNVYEGIYKFDGDDLVLALYTGAGNKRPAKFDSEKDSKVVVVTFKREKK